MARYACTWVDARTICDPMYGIWNRRGDLTGIHIRAGYKLYEPNALIAPDGSLTGYFPDLFYKLQESLNFTYSLVKAKSFGSLQVQLFSKHHIEGKRMF